MSSYQKVVCQLHGTIVLHHRDDRCPLCESKITQAQLLAALCATFPPVPDEYHSYAVIRGEVVLIGPDCGYCVREGEPTSDPSIVYCTHSPFAPVVLPLVVGGRVVRKEGADSRVYTINYVEGGVAFLWPDSHEGQEKALRVPLAELRIANREDEERSRKGGSEGKA